ncbi:MAG: asparagine synthase (glutamine-hydrolyzing) [Firmicutes bacterium]|nr:asparagine synthase (glutamine-hydrolyzing) [Bacillota bacterium]
MCAISGIVGLPGSEETAAKMLSTMYRRGPDDKGVYRSGGCTLLHGRLAIIDPAGGRQPMLLSWAGETYALVYNGELYNTEELRWELTGLGHTFLGHSDTEVLLHAYAQFGADCVEKLNGIFAFGVWEEKRRRLFLARDRIGVKPLFYKRHRGGLLFASEIKTILAYPTVRAELDETGAAQLILLGPGRLPGSGVFKDIFELEPGCCGYFADGDLRLRRYWKLRDREHRDSFEETVEKVRFLVTDAIRRQMVSDVPIGTFLSGGLDSSVITAVCAGEMAGRGERLKTFSVDYENNDKYFRPSKFQPNSDSDYIHLMVDTLHTDHRWTVLTPENLADALEDATIARDLPGMADVDFSLLAFCGEIRENVKVALSGECADEIFGGYPWYRDPEVRAREGFPWAQNTQDRVSLLTGAVCLDPTEFVMDAYSQTCRESDILPGTSDQERRMKQMVNMNFRWFMQTLLDRKDRMSMYHSLEVRVPFCDYRIAEYLYGVPWEYKDYQGQEKGLLRQAVAGLLSEEVRLRKKSPYPKTFDPRYERLMEERLQRILDDPAAPLWQLISAEAVRKLLQSQTQWPWYGQLMRRPQIMAYLCQIDFWLRHYRVELVF